MSWKSYLLSSLIIGVFATLGWHLGSPSKVETGTKHSEKKPIYSTPKKVFTSQKSSRASTEKMPIPEQALPNERLIQFSSSQDLAQFLNDASVSNIRLLGGNKKRNTLRVSFTSLAELEHLLPSDTELFYNYPAFPPMIEEGDLNPNAIGFYGKIKELMGIPEENASWGSGVKVAVIDTGIMDHEVFTGNTVALSLVDTGGKAPHPHGTAMASIWRDGNGRLPSIAPAVDLLSIQVSNETGASNLYTISEAIFLATDQGADLVTISMSSFGTNPYLGQAVQYAKDHGTLVLASAGNNGETVEVYPAGHPDVLAITSIDGSGNDPGFSNKGEFISFSAPGVAIPSAGPEDTYTFSTGTSPSAQLGAATIAIIMSELGINDPYKASELVLENLNERGLPGVDDIYGAGYPQLDVILNHDVEGLYDGAIAANLLQLDTPNNSAQVQVVIDNPGTEPLANASLFVTANGKSVEAPLPTIQAKESFLYELPISVSLGKDEISVNSRLELGNSLQDIRPQDNSQKSNFSLQEKP